MAVLPGLRINSYFTDILGLSWTMDRYQQHQAYQTAPGIHCIYADFSGAHNNYCNVIIRPWLYSESLFLGRKDYVEQ